MILFIFPSQNLQAEEWSQSFMFNAPNFNQMEQFGEKNSQAKAIECIIKTQKVKSSSTERHILLAWQSDRNLKGKIMEFTKRESNRNHRCRQKRVYP